MAAESPKLRVCTGATGFDMDAINLINNHSPVAQSVEYVTTKFFAASNFSGLRITGTILQHGLPKFTLSYTSSLSPCSSLPWLILSLPVDEGGTA
jgi:hypothetical protein